MSSVNEHINQSTINPVILGRIHNKVHIIQSFINGSQKVRQAGSQAVSQAGSQAGRQSIRIVGQSTESDGQSVS